MQGFGRAGRELLDAAALAGHLIPAGNMFAFPAAHRGGVFPTIMRACSSAGGGPAVAAGHADGGGPDAAGAARLRRPGDRRGGPLRRAVEGGDRVLAGGCGSGPSSLVYWRSRIARSGRPDRVSDPVKKVIEATGALKGRRRRAVGSTILAGRVATQDTVTQLVAAIRPGIGPGVGYRRSSPRGWPGNGKRTRRLRRDVAPATRRPKTCSLTLTRDADIRNPAPLQAGLEEPHSTAAGNVSQSYRGCFRPRTDRRPGAHYLEAHRNACDLGAATVSADGSED